MKKYFVCVMLGLIGSVCQAQDWKEKLEQILKLQVYIHQIEKGYAIAKKGLTTIGDIKKGHFSLDKNFFAGLQQINPQVKNYAKVADIITLNMAIVTGYKNTMKEARGSRRLTNPELDYMEKVFTQLINGCIELTDELMAVLTPSTLQLSDDERIHRIDRLYSNMQERSTFAQAFSKEAHLLAIQRSREVQDAAAFRRLYGE